MTTTDVLRNIMIIYALGIFTPNTDWILFTLVALYTHVPPRSISLTMDTSILHFCASSFCVSFFSHRAFRIASLVALATYLVFFALSSASVALFAVIAATTADAEFLVAVAVAAVAASLYEPAVEVGFDLLNVTGVQSWQSGACVSAALYRFR
jgi:hypothetical protein